MTDNPTLFTEVLRRAEERRAHLKDRIAEFSEEVSRHEMLRREALDALTAAQAELATLEYLVAPLADQEVAWCNTEKAQPSSRPEPRRTQRTLQELVFSAVAEHPGQGQGFLADVLTKRRRWPTDAGLVKTILHAHPDKVEWREGWYLAGDQGSQLDIYRCDLCGAEQRGAVPAFCRRDGCYQPHRASGVMRLATEHPGREKATGSAGGDEQETGHCPVSALPPADNENGGAYASGMSVLMDPDVPTIWDESDARAYEFAGLSDTDRDELARPLSEPRGAPSAETPAKIPPTPETALQTRPPSPGNKTPEATLDYIRRAGPPGLSEWQLRNHVANIAGLVERGAVELGEDKRYRHVVAGEEVEAAK